MYQYILKRLGFMSLTLFLVTVITFAVTNILPGDVALLILGPNASEESLTALQAQLGLNRPLYIQYWDWIVSLAQGDMGESLRFGEPVSKLIAERLPRSLLLAVTATAVAVTLSIPLGVYAAINQNELSDISSSMVALAGISLPIFLWGLIFILFFAVWIPIFPTGGYVSPTEDLVEAITHLVLPAGAIGFALTAYIMRMTRSSMLEVLGEEFINLARAKGMSQRVIIFKHALKNALIPVITVIAFQFSYAFGGIVVLEEVFTWPGIGRLMLTAIQSRDIPLIQGSIIVVAIIYMVSNFLADMAYAYFDPRIRYGGE